MTSDPGVENAIDRVSELLGRQIGLRSQSNLRGRLRRSVLDEAAAHGQDIDRYVDQLAAHDVALQGLLNHITVQESSFFRHPEHFAVLAHDILPGLPPPITIWSAGCANGQEPFSLAMVLDELDLDGTVIATDLSTAALQRTAAGSYTTKELTGLSPERIRSHLTATGPDWRINPRLRARVKPLHHNLIEPLPEQVRSSQVLFCRNVLIYFAPEHARTFLDRVADALPAAVVFLGSAETMWSVTDRFRTIRAGDSYHYRLRTAAAPDLRSVSADRPSVPAASRPVSVPVPVPVPVPVRAATPVPGRAPVRPSTVEPAASSDSSAVSLALTGHLAFDAGDYRSAVVAFRKCVYLTPDDALAHLHLGLAFEAAGDLPPARRAFATARRAVRDTASTQTRYDIGGYAPSELLSLLDAKLEADRP